MDSSSMLVEIYEWKEGYTRPGSTRKAREDCIDFYEIPKGGPIPIPGDILLIRNEINETGEWLTPYRVVEREHLLGIIHSDINYCALSSLLLRWLQKGGSYAQARDPRFRYYAYCGSTGNPTIGGIAL